MFVRYYIQIWIAIFQVWFSRIFQVWINIKSKQETKPGKIAFFPGLDYSKNPNKKQVKSNWNPTWKFGIFSSDYVHMRLICWNEWKDSIKFTLQIQIIPMDTDPGNS